LHLKYEKKGLIILVFIHLLLLIILVFLRCHLFNYRAYVIDHAYFSYCVSKRIIKIIQIRLLFCSESWILFAMRCFPKNNTNLTIDERPESAAEESRDALFLHFSSFPPFIRAPVVIPRLISWFLLCHTRPYIYIHTPRAFFLYGTLGWVILRQTRLPFSSLSLLLFGAPWLRRRRDYKSPAIKTVVRRFDGPCQDALSS